MKLIYGVNDKPKFGQLLVFAIQQLLAIMTATLVVPVIIGNDMSPAAALFGAGVGTLVYILFRFSSVPHSRSSVRCWRLLRAVYRWLSDISVLS